MTSAAEQLKTQGFVSVSYPLALRTKVIETYELWKGFCELPVALKAGLPYSNGADGVGYELKDGDGINADRKENFDVTLEGLDWLKSHSGEIGNPLARAFIQNAAELVGALKPIIVSFAQDSESAFSLPRFADEVVASEATFFVRFIHYFGNRRAEEAIAAAHVDQSGFALHLFESDPGLQLLTRNDVWVDMPVSEDETVIFPGLQMQFRSQGEILATCHRVVATPETAKIGRYSAVCFVQLKNTQKYNKARHGRLQEKIPGFNYKLSLEELQDLFA